MQQTLTLYPHKDYLEQSHCFINTYDLIDVIIPGRIDLNVLKPKKERICRFCGKKYGDTKFKEKVHLIPEMLGNKELLSDFECYQCNHYFDKFEDQLSKFLGIYRTLTGTKGKEGIPGFTSPGKAIKAKGKIILDDETIIISRESIENGAIIVDPVKGLINIKYKRNPFSPLMVYKAILKIALSIINDSEIKSDYALALDYLMGRDNIMFTGCLINGYVFPFNYKPFVPYAYLFKKRDINAKTHTHLMALYFQNLIFAFPVPLNKNDLFFYNNKEEQLNFNLYPPFLPYENTGDLALRGFQEIFSSEEKVRDSEDEIIIEIDTEQLAQSRVFNSKNDQLYDSKFNPSEIVQIVIRRNNGPVNPRELVKALKQHQKP
jgi:hypothetical protein